MDKHTVRIDWQYDGAAPWVDVVRWCNSTIPEHTWSNGFETITFTSHEAFTLFSLKWL